MKKLLFTTSTLPRFEGDPEPRFVLDLAKSLSDRYHITILAPADPEAKLNEKNDNITIVRYRYAPMRCMERLAYPGAILPRLKNKPWLWVLVPLLVLGLYRALLKLGVHNFDLVHCHWLVPQGMVQAFGFAGSKAPPFIVTSHGGDLTSFKGRIMRRLFSSVIDRASCITVVSHALTLEFESTLACAPVIPMGVNTETFGPQHAIHGFFNSIAGDNRVILFVGRLAEKKGLDVLLKAMSDPQVRNLDCHLIIVGQGPQQRDLESLRSNLGLQDKVNFLPPVSHLDLPVIYASSDIFCAPSVVAANGDTDGLPTVLLEASASRIPCITTPVGGIPDFIENEINGLLVPPGDITSLAEAIARLFKNKEERLRLGNEALKSVQAFSWPVIADRFVSIYQSVLSPDDIDKSR